MAGLTDTQYKAKEARTEVGIVAGNALNAAAAARITKDPADIQGYAAATLELAATYFEWLMQARDDVAESPFLGPRVTGTTQEDAPVSAAAPAASEESPSSVKEAVQNVKAAFPETEEVFPPPCPKCGGDMWDNREKKQSGQFAANAPDASCKDRDACGGAIWPEKKARGASTRKRTAPSARAKEVAASVGS